MLRQLGTFGPIKSHILKGTINDYFSKAEQGCVCCISRLKCSCGCARVCARHCAAAAASRVTEECIWSQSQWSFLSAELAWRGSPSWTDLDHSGEKKQEPQNHLWVVHIWQKIYWMFVCVNWFMCRTTSASHCYLTSWSLELAESYRPIVPTVKMRTHTHLVFFSWSNSGTYCLLL